MIKIITYILFILLLGLFLPIGLFVDSWVMVKLYNWFILSVFPNMPSLSLYQMMGISIFKSLMFFKHPIISDVVHNIEADDKVKFEYGKKILLSVYVTPFIILLIAYILKFVVM